MHLVNTEKHFWGGYAVVGGHPPLAAGLALAEQYRGTDNAVICYMATARPTSVTSTNR